MLITSGYLENPATKVVGLNSEGGWAQLKFAPLPKLEFNTAFGQDNPFAADFRQFAATESYSSTPPLRNRSAFVNVIARPRSDLVLSLEYRRLRTFELSRTSDMANQVNLGMGVLF